MHMALAFITIVCWSIVGQSIGASSLPNLANAVEKVTPATVTISVSTKAQPALPKKKSLQGSIPPGHPLEELFKHFYDYQGGGLPDRMPKEKAIGSGFVIDAKGFVVTNYHVVSMDDNKVFDKITVITNDDKEYDAKVIGVDPFLDLALLKIDGKEPFPAVKWGDSKSIRRGDWVFAVGSPFGYGGTVTAGIVSMRSRDISKSPLADLQIPDYVGDLIQSNVDMNRGNSGGGLFNLNGEVIGVNTIIVSPNGGSVGLSFSIPSNVAQNAIDQIMKYGKVKHGKIGLAFQPIKDSISESLGLEKGVGVLVVDVAAGGPAERAGIQVGDVIVSYNNTPLRYYGRQFAKMVRETPIGTDVPIEVSRKGEMKVLAIKVEESTETKTTPQGVVGPKADNKDGLDADGKTLKINGIVFKLQDSKVIVASIESDYDRGFRPNDVIMSVNQNTVGALQDIQKAIDDAKKNKRNHVLFLLKRGEDKKFITLSLSDTPPEDDEREDE